MIYHVMDVLLYRIQVVKLYRLRIKIFDFKDRKPYGAVQFILNQPIQVSELVQI